MYYQNNDDYMRDFFYFNQNPTMHNNMGCGCMQNSMNNVMKHIKHYLITTAISLCCFVANAHDFEVDGIYYNITSATDRTVMVTFKGDYSSNYGNEYIGVVTIPSTVTYRSKTYRVTSIGEDAFWYCSSLTSIDIPESVTSIGEDAFWYCSSLTSVTISLHLPIPSQL